MKNSQVILLNTTFTKNLSHFVAPITKAAENLDIFHDLEMY